MEAFFMVLGIIVLIFVFCGGLLAIQKTTDWVNKDKDKGEKNGKI